MGISLHATNGERGDYQQATAAAFLHAFHHTTVRHPQSTTEHATQSLDRRLVCDRRNALRLVVLRADRPLAPRHHRLPLQVHVSAVLLRLLLLLCVRLHAADELVSAPGVADVLDADVDALLDVAVADLSVENDADGGLCDVVDDTSLAVVDLAGAVSIAATDMPNTQSLCAASSAPLAIVASSALVSTRPCLPCMAYPSGQHRLRPHQRCLRPCTA